MARSLADIMEALAAELRKEEEGDASQKTEDRIAALEAQLAQAKKGADPADVAEAFEELSDEEWKLIDDHRKAKTTPPPPAPNADPPPLPRQKLTRQIHRIHSGDDEPDEVRYIDAESGTEAVRPGRKKGQPYEWQVDDVPEEPAA